MASVLLGEVWTPMVSLTEGGRSRDGAGEAPDRDEGNERTDMAGDVLSETGHSSMSSKRMAGLKEL